MINCIQSSREVIVKSNVFEMYILKEDKYIIGPYVSGHYLILENYPLELSTIKCFPLLYLCDRETASVLYNYLQINMCFDFLYFCLRNRYSTDAEHPITITTRSVSVRGEGDNCRTITTLPSSHQHPLNIITTHNNPAPANNSQILLHIDKIQF